MAEFIANTNDFTSTKLFLFYILRFLYLCISFDIIDLSDKRTCKYINKKKVLDISKTIFLILKYAQKYLIKVKLSQLNQVNKYWKEIFYNIKDKI